MANKLTVQQVAAYRKKQKPYKVSVDTGLHLRIATNGVKTWFVRYVVDGKQREYRLAAPWGENTDAGHLSLADARDEAAKIRKLAREGIDYQIQLEQAREAATLQLAKNHAENKTVNDLLDAWIETVKRSDGGAELRRSFGRDVLPTIGAKPLKELVEGDISELLQAIVDRGANRLAVVTLGSLKQMFRWGEGRRPWKLLIDNPVAGLKPDGITSPEYAGNERTRTLSDAEVRELVKKLPTAGLRERTQLAVWIVLACCTRIGETVKARWQHVDLDLGEWFIPGANTKNGLDHTVYLSEFAVRHFRQLRDLDNETAWCFPDSDGTSHVCVKSASKQIGDRQLSAMGRKPMAHRSKSADALILSGGNWKPHDLRRTGATTMQSMGVTPEVIERALNHIEQNKLKRIYHRHDYAKEKREAWRLLGERLDLLTREDADNVVPFGRKTGT